MNNGHARRQRSTHRNSTPAAICLPPPKPPENAARPDPATGRAIPLTSASEALVTDAAASRQTRRQQRRQHAKAQRRGHGATATPAMATEQSAQPAHDPLPRNRSLTIQKPSRLRAVGQWLRSLVMVDKPRSGALATQDGTAAQIRAMRSEMAAMQRTLDRMLRKMAT